MSSPFTKKQLAKYRDRLEVLIDELEKLDSITRESRKPVEETHLHAPAEYLST